MPDISPKLPEVKAEFQQLDLLALLSDAIDHLNCIRTHAEHESSWRQVFIEAHRAIRILEAVKSQESLRWSELAAALEARRAARASAQKEDQP